MEGGTRCLFLLPCLLCFFSEVGNPILCHPSFQAKHNPPSCEVAQNGVARSCRASPRPPRVSDSVCTGLSAVNGLLVHSQLCAVGTTRPPSLHASLSCNRAALAVDTLLCQINPALPSLYESSTHDARSCRGCCPLVSLRAPRRQAGRDDAARLPHRRARGCQGQALLRVAQRGCRGRAEAQ